MSALSISIGCQQSPYKIAPVHGTVTIDGRPFTHGKVMFAPVAHEGDHNPGKPAFGWLQEDGSFTLTTYKQDDGAVVGEHSVTIINIDPAQDDSPKPAVPSAQSQLIPKFSRAPVPGKFQVVSGQDNRFEIKLSRQEATRFAAHK